MKRILSLVLFLFVSLPIFSQTVDTALYATSNGTIISGNLYIKKGSGGGKSVATINDSGRVVLKTPDVFSSSYIGGAGTSGSPFYNIKANRSDSIPKVNGGYVDLSFDSSDSSLVVNGIKFYRNGSAPSGPVLENLTFSGVVGISNSSNVYTGTAGSSGQYAGYAVATKRLAAGQDGYIQYQYTGNASDNAILSFSTTNTSQSYQSGNYVAGIYTYQGDFYKTDGGTLSSAGASAITNNYYKIQRTGSTITLQTSVSAGTGTWTNVFTYTYTSNSDLYIKINLDYGASIYYPKGYNLQ